MTRDELLEDMNVGDVVKIYTESNETFEGKIVDFGESGLKISLLQGNKAKRIMYSRIIEYDIDFSVSKMESIEKRENNDNAEEEKNLPIENNINQEKKFEIDRNNIFDNTDLSIDLENIRNVWSGKLETKQNNEYMKASNILEYAKKIHEYTLDNDRVKRAIAVYKKLADDIIEMNVFIALIYHEFNDIKTAMEYYNIGGAYDVVFLLSLQYGYDDLFEKAILAVEHNPENEKIVRWLCEYAVKNNDFAVVSHVISHSDELKGKTLLYWYADKKEIASLPDKNDIYASSNILYLKNVATGEVNENDAHIKTILSNVRRNDESTNVEENGNKKTIYQGIISYYNKNYGYGSIKNVDGGSIYFSI